MYVDLLKNSQTAMVKMMEKASQPTKIPLPVGGTIPFPNINAWIVTFMLVFCLACMILCTIFATFAAFAILISTTIGLSFVLAFGPLFGSFLLFPQTKQLFEGWFKQCLNFVLTKIFVVAAIFLMSETILNLFGFEGATDTKTMPGIAGIFSPSQDYATYISDQFSAIGELCITFLFGAAFVLMFGLFITKLPHIATSLTGGAEMNGGVASQAANNSAIRHGMNALVAPQNAIGKAAAAAAKNQEAKGHKRLAGALRWIGREFPFNSNSNEPQKGPTGPSKNP